MSGQVLEDLRQARAAGAPAAQARAAGPARMDVRTARHLLRTARRAVAVTYGLGVAVTAGQCAALVLTRGIYGVGEAPSLGDFLAFALMGSSQPAPATSLTPTELTHTPFGWLALVLLPAVLVALLGARDDLSAHALVASASRTAHWLGRCLAVMVGCLGFWAALTLTCAAAALAAGGAPSSQASDWLPLVADLEPLTLPDPPYEAAGAWAGAVGVSCGLALVQLALSELLGRRVSFLAVAAVLAGSVFAMSPALLGNWMMAARSTVFVVGWAIRTDEGLLQAGLSPGVAAGVAAALAAAGVAAGCAVARRRDYLGGVAR